MDDSGGYDANFIVPPPNELICPVCTCVVRDPIQIVGCGHRLCSACYTSLKKFNNNCTCPTDRTVIRDDKVFPDVGADRTVLSLEVKCDYFAKGCVWVGELRDLQKHIENCFHQRIDGLVNLQDKVAKLEKILEDKNTEVKDLKRMIENIERMIENIAITMKNSSKEKDTEISGLKRLVEKLMEQLQFSSKATVQKDTEFTALKRLVEKLMKQIQSSSKTLSSVEEKLVTSLDHKDTEISGLQRIVNKIMKRLETYTEQKDTEISGLQNLLEKIMKQPQSSPEQVNKEIKGLKVQVENLMKQSSSKTVSSFEAKCTSNTSELNDLRSLLYFDTDRLDRCRKEIETIKDERRSTEIELGGLREDLNNCTTNLQSLSDRVDDTMKNVGEPQEIIKVDDELPDIRKSIVTLENTIDNYRKEIATLKTRFKEKHIDCSVKFEKTEEFLNVISNHVRSQERKMDTYLKSMEALQRLIPSDLRDQIIPRKYWCDCVMNLNGRMDNLARIAHESLPNMDKRISERDERVKKSVRDMETLNKCYFVLYIITNHIIDLRHYRYWSLLPLVGSSLIYYFREPIYLYIKESIDRYFSSRSNDDDGECCGLMED